MKITFIYPAIGNSGFSRTARPILYSQIHPGLCILAAVVKKEGFKDITLIDLRMLSGWDDFRSRIEKESPDVVCVTTMSPDFNYAKRCLEIVKEACPAARTIIGGMHPTVKTSDVLREKTADHVIIGEGETVLPQILRAIENKQAPERVIHGTLADLDRLPFMDRELFDFLEMPYDFFLPLPFVTMLAGRGCSYGCKFCSPAGKLMHGPKIRRRSVSRVIDELQSLRDVYGFRSVQFWDDCFADDKDWIMEFCASYRKNGFRQPFVCQMRADIICRNPDMMKTLKETGLAMASIGFESGSDRILKFVNKRTTVMENLEAARICKRLGIKVWAFLMFGVPTETNDEAADTLGMVRKMKPYRASPAFFTPHPGSTFYDYCKTQDLMLIDECDDFVTFPEVDKPKIKGIDYGFMRQLAVKSKKTDCVTKARIRINRLMAHGNNKKFRIAFEEEVRRYPGLNKMAVLRLARQAGRP